MKNIDILILLLLLLLLLLLHPKVVLSTFELKSGNFCTSFLAAQLLSTLFQIRDI